MKPLRIGSSLPIQPRQRERWPLKLRIREPTVHRSVAKSIVGSYLTQDAWAAQLLLNRDAGIALDKPCRQRVWETRPPSERRQILGRPHHVGECDVAHRLSLSVSTIYPCMSDAPRGQINHPAGGPPATERRSTILCLSGVHKFTALQHDAATEESRTILISHAARPCSGSHLL